MTPANIGGLSAPNHFFVFVYVSFCLYVFVFLRSFLLLWQVKAGTLVLLHHSLVHYSKANTSEKSRHAYSIHVVEGKEGFRYPPDNWLQRPADKPFEELP